MKAPSLALAFLCFLLTSHSRVSARQVGQPAGTSDQETQAASVAGQVLGADSGEPLRKARILLRSADDDSADPYIAITDSEGRFLMTGVRPGRYSMRVAREGFLSKSYGEAENGNSSSILSLKAGQQLNDLIFRLQKYAVIAGRVLDEDGDPARFVSVEAFIRFKHRGKISMQAVDSVSTNDLGEYRLFDLDPGAYLISASVGQRSWSTIGKVNIDSSILKTVGGYVRTYYPGVSEAQRASAIEVKAGDEISRVDIILIRQRSYKVRGQVINAAVDHPTAEVRVEAVPEGLESYGLGDLRGGKADRKSGEFEIPDIPPRTVQNRSRIPWRRERIFRRNKH